MAAKHLKEKEKAMISKSEMLDQVSSLWYATNFNASHVFQTCCLKVNELMDTMTAERLALTEKIASLEVSKLFYVCRTIYHSLMCTCRSSCKKKNKLTKPHPLSQSILQ